MVTCALCKGEATLLDAPYLDAFWQESSPFKDLRLHRCEDCGLGFTLPPVPEEELTRFYSEIYHAPSSIHHLDETSLRFSGLDTDPRSLSQVLLALGFTQFGHGSWFVDLGAGPGASFQTVRSIFPGARLAAVEVSPRATQALRRNFPDIVVAPNADVLLRALAPARAQLMLASHVMEHIEAAGVVPFLESAARLLDPEAALVVEVPFVDLGTHHARLRYNDAPHLTFFTREALRVALERAGFRVRFLDSVDTTYEAWWGDHTTRPSAQAPAATPTKRGIGPKVRGIARRALPPGARLRVSVAMEALRGVNRVHRLLSAENFHYGGDRTVLRAVATLA